jgi:hypothetical protein
LKQIRKRLTYANVMSSIAVFLILGGATAFAAKKIGPNQLKANSVKTGKIVKEAVTTSKLKNESVTTNKLDKDAVTSDKIADNAVTTAKIANDAVTGAKVNESTLSGVVQNVTYVGTATGGGSEDERNLTVDCGAGRRAIGGFYEAFDLGADVKITVHIMRRVTIAGEQGRGLEVFAEEITATGNAWQLTATAACATI